MYYCELMCLFENGLSFVFYGKGTNGFFSSFPFFLSCLSLLCTFCVLIVDVYFCSVYVNVNFVFSSIQGIVNPFERFYRRNTQWCHPVFPPFSLQMVRLQISRSSLYRQ